VFRISIADTPSRRTLLVEGTFIGAWVAEVGTTWRNASQDLGARKLVIDLTNVTVMSPEGEDVLFDLMKKGVYFSSSGVLITTEVNMPETKHRLALRGSRKG
jgi:anti-anti-sigma regulatory factor